MPGPYEPTPPGSGRPKKRGLIWAVFLLIVAGVYLFFRDRRIKKVDNGEAGFESTDEVMDAILALDDLHRAGKISDLAYQNRRNELKDIIKEIN